MKRIYLLLAGLALLATACDENKENVTPVDPIDGDFSNVPVRVTPLITRATETDFEISDAIGLSITRATGVYVENAKLTFDGTAFSGDLNWYAEGADPSTLAAYYPYSQSIPTTFTVASDQSTLAGLASSDFLSSIKEEVLPSASAVSMVFKHQLSRMAITLVNNSGAEIEGVVLKGANPTAVIAADLTAEAAPGTVPADITAGKIGDKYYAILPPQTVSLTAAVAIAGTFREQQLTEATLLPGKQYSISIIVNREDIKVVLSGEIENWTDGGEIGGQEPESDTQEYLENNYIVYAGENYRVVKMKDDKWWMAENLRYLPEGVNPANDLTAVTAGVFFPLKVNEGKTALEFATDAETIAANGYLYQIEFALGVGVGNLPSKARADVLEGTRGICPLGWHIPTAADIMGLVGKSVGFSDNADAPYYVNGNGSIVKLNEDGFNIDAYGAISIQDNTKTTGSFMGWASGYPDKISSCMLLGSTCAGETYNTSGDPESGIKNMQFFGLMPMTNKATEEQYTCNGTKVSYRIAGPLRCVRDAE